MQSIRSAIMRHVRMRESAGEWLFTYKGNNLDTRSVHQQVTETAYFQKDLCLDSLDRVELVMAFEEEFSIEIPDEKADKLTC